MLRNIQVNGVQFRVADEGLGPVILFVHGFPLNHSMWQAQIEEFSRTHRVIAPDLRGFGGTDGALYSVSMEQFADDLAELLDALAVEGPVIFCGLSMGGYIAWQFTQRHRNRISKLIVCDTRAAAEQGGLPLVEHLASGDRRPAWVAVDINALGRPAGVDGNRPSGSP